MNIYIDNFNESEEFVIRLVKRLQILKKYGVTVTVYDILRGDGPDLFGYEFAEKLNNFDIIIPIVTPDYLAETEFEVNDVLDEIIDNENKYIIPIIYKPTNWSSKKWIVGSQPFPEDKYSLTELNEKQQEEILNKIVQTIENIVAENSIYKNKKTMDIEVPATKSIFISHSHNDADFAELLKLNLEKEGFNSWIDNEKLKIGQEWRKEIDDGISDSLAIIVIMSPEAKQSEYVTYEWSYAWGKGKNIFPIMLKQTSLHPRLESLQYLDFTNRITRPWDKLYESLKKL